jgi:hypothetical protein
MDQRKLNLDHLQDLDFDAEGLTEDEKVAVVVAIFRGHGREPIARREVERQAAALGNFMIETKANVNMSRLILKGLLCVAVQPDGEIKFRATEKAFKTVKSAAPN